MPALPGKFWARIFIGVLFIALLGWCQHQQKSSYQNLPIRAELHTIFLEQGLILGDQARPDLAEIAKKAGPAKMNELLFEVASTASLDALKWLVAHGADPKDIGQRQGKTLLQAIVASPKAERLQFFLNLGLDPHEKSRDGKTLMHFAAQGGMDKAMLALLQAKGLNPNERDSLGRYPMHYAGVRAISTLVSIGAEIDSKDENGMTPLHNAAHEGRGEIVAEFIRHGASVFAKDNKGRTALHHAANATSADAVVDALLAAGAPTTARDNDGNTPKELAIDARERRRYQHHSLLDKL